MKAPGFWWKKNRGIVALLLSPISGLYGIGAARARSAKPGGPGKVRIPVICVGNATVGGAGKTPVVIDIAHRLKAQGANPHCLSRGYGGTLEGPVKVEPDQHSFRDVGDEPLLLARKAPTWIAKDRFAGAQAAEADGASHIIMDDGYQNPSLYKDLNLLVVDASMGVGNGCLLPAGPLREPIAGALDRADAVISIGTKTLDLFAPIPPHVPVIQGYPVAKWRPIQGFPQRYIAFTGIGNPHKFFSFLRTMKIEVTHEFGFPDHHPYSDRDIEKLRGISKHHGRQLLTTEKDAVRLPPAFREEVKIMPIAMYWEQEDAFDALLQKVL